MALASVEAVDPILEVSETVDTGADNRVKPFGRLSSLARFHCGGPLDLDFRSLIAQAQQVRLVNDETRWMAWTRYSARQDRRMEWEGLVGAATYEGTFGLGGYREP